MSRWLLPFVLATTIVGSLGGAARADIGPMEPARSICMGKSDGAACTIDGKAGTCQGPHPSRMYCTVGGPAQPTPEPAKPDPVEPAKPEPKPDPVEPAKPAPTEPTAAPTEPKLPLNPQPAPTSPKTGCTAGTGGDGLGALVLVGAALGIGRRRSRR